MLSLWISGGAGRRRTRAAARPGAAHLPGDRAGGPPAAWPAAALRPVWWSALPGRGRSYPVRADGDRSSSSGTATRASPEGAALFLTVFLLPASCVLTPRCSPLPWGIFFLRRGWSTGYPVDWRCLEVAVEICQGVARAAGARWGRGAIVPRPPTLHLEVVTVHPETVSRVSILDQPARSVAKDREIGYTEARSALGSSGSSRDEAWVLVLTGETR